MLCNYQGRVESVIGDSKYSEGTLEKTLRREFDWRQERKRSADTKPQSLVEKEIEMQLPESGVSASYHGWDTICNLCTGDVSNILELLNRMFDECSVKQDSSRLIRPDYQSAVIEGYATQYISKIKGIPRHGERMFAIVNAFGNLSRRLLESYPLVKHGAGREEPFRLLRVELDETFQRALGADDVATDNEGPVELWKYLQRYSIFIDAETGRSRRNTLSSRVILRRIFCPAFRIGLVNSECLTLSLQQWEAFCEDPSGRAEQYSKENIEKALRRRGEFHSDKQGKLPFPEVDEECT